MNRLVRALARRFCDHGEAELRELQRRTRNAEVSYTRLRRLAGKAGRRAVAAERANDPATRAIVAASRAIAALAKKRDS